MKFVFSQFAQATGLVVVIVFAIASVLTTALSAFGILPWLSLSMGFGETPWPYAGMALQIGLSVLLLSLLAILPASFRVMQLEYAHRRFEIDMDDITRAYRAAHMADRAETFEMQREFDAVRERYRFLKEQPSFDEMDDLLLTIAAQMSEQSREMADRFSDTRLQRLREQLRHRRQEVDALLDRSTTLRQKASKLKTVSDDIQDDEARAIANLMAAQDDVLPRRPVIAGDNVEHMQDFRVRSRLGEG